MPKVRMPGYTASCPRTRSLTFETRETIVEIESRFQRLRTQTASASRISKSPRRLIIPEVVQGYPKCGDLAAGFARVRCPDFHHEYLLGFICRSAGSAPVATPRKLFSLVCTSRKISCFRFSIGNIFSVSRLVDCCAVYPALIVLRLSITINFDS